MPDQRRVDCIECPTFVIPGVGKQPTLCPKGVLDLQYVTNNSVWWNISQGETNVTLYQCLKAGVCSFTPSIPDTPSLLSTSLLNTQISAAVSTEVLGYSRSCLQGREGPLCALCQRGLVKIGGECQKCEASPTEGSLAAFVFVFVWIVGCIGVDSSVAEKDVTPVHSVLLTAMLDFTSMASVLGDFPYKFPSALAGTYAATNASALNVQGISCVTTFDYATATAVSVTSPFIGLFMFCVYGALKGIFVYARGQDFKQFRRKFLQGTLLRALLFIFILCFTSIARTSYRALLCIEVNGVSYLKEDMSVVCWSSNAHAVIVGWASLGFFQIAILPLLLAALVRYRVGQVEGSQDRLTGFLYDSFRQGASAWESLRLYRKALLCAVLMIDGLVIQAMAATALITTSITFTAMFAPFRSRLANALDILGQIVLVYVLYMSSALFFSGNVNSSHQQSGGALLASLIILVIVSFLAAICGVTALQNTNVVDSDHSDSDHFDSILKLKAKLSNKDAELVNMRCEYCVSFPA
jgi:hypothetical protein